MAGRLQGGARDHGAAERRRGSSTRPTRSSASTRPASAAPTSGRIAASASARTPGRCRWATSTSGSSKMSAPASRQSGRDSSSSARSGPPTTPARSATAHTRAPASTASRWARSAPKPICCASPLADGTLVATPDIPTDDLIPSLLAASDVLGTGWFATVAAEAGPGKTVAVVGDGAVGLLAVLAAKQLGAERNRDEPPR